jgi:hypothetical protein
VIEVDSVIGVVDGRVCGLVDRGTDLEHPFASAIEPSAAPPNNSPASRRNSLLDTLLFCIISGFHRFGGFKCFNYTTISQAKVRRNCIQIRNNILNACIYSIQWNKDKN